MSKFQRKNVKLTSDLDVSVSLAEHLKDPKLVAEKLLIVKEKNSLSCMIKPKTFLSYETWSRINSWVHRQGGKWHRKEKLWTIPLQRKTQRVMTDADFY